MVLAYTSVVIAFVGTIGQPNSVHDLAHPTDQGRYFVVAAWTILLVGVAAIAARRRAGLILCLAVAIGLWSTAWVVGVEGPAWARVGSNTACTAGSVVWPADGAGYRLPVGVQAEGWIYPK